MGSLQDIDVEVVVQEDGTSHRGHPDRFLPNFKKVDGLCDQTMGNPVMAPGTEMKRNVNQDFQGA